MLYEVRAYTFTVGTAAQAVEDFGRIIERRTQLSRLIGFFRSGLGARNRILHIWEYEDSAHREAVRAETLRQPWWPPLKAATIVYQQTRLMRAAPFREAPRTGAMGGAYEIRSDVMHTGGFPALCEAWAKTLPERERLSPLAAAFANPAGAFESGILNEVLTVWPYRDLNHLAEVHEAAEKLTAWREHPGDLLVRQTSEVWWPTAYSPMH